MVERARVYNADRANRCSLERFGCSAALNPGVDPLGDVDIELTYGRRITDQIAPAERRPFGTYFDELIWPQSELVRHLKNRSAFINITLEDISRITGTFYTLYRIHEDPATVPPPTDRTPVGR